MSGTDTEEPMDVDVRNNDINQASAHSNIQQHPTAADKPAADEDETLIVLSLKWINPDGPQKLKRPESSLQKMFQSWFSKCKPKVDCSVKKILTDGRVVIKTEPAPAIKELQKLIQQTLTGKDGSSVTVTSVSLALPPPQRDTQTPAEASMNLPPSLPQTDEDEALIVLSLKWINPGKPQKMKRPESRLEKMLQSWFDKCKRKPDCSVENILTDGSVVIKINPAPAVTELQRLSQQTLTGRDGSSVTVTSISLPPPGFDTQTPADASKNLPPSLPQTEQVRPEEQSNVASAAGEMLSCSVPVGLFWYVNHMYEEELKRIEEVNGVKIGTEVKFEVVQKDGSPDKALEEFTDLIQARMTEFSGSVIPLKFKDPDQWRDALKTIQKKENKLLVTLTSKGMSACGPKYSQDVIRKFFNADAHQKRKPSASSEEYEREMEDTPLKINLTTQDRFPDEGLIMEEIYWKLMSTSYNEQVKRIKDKFNVELKDSNISQGKVGVKAFYKKGGGNASMESHALTALLRLYQKIAASPMNFSQLRGASRSLINTNSVHQSGGASNGPVLNGQSANRKHNADAPHGGGATAGDGEEEKCPICLDEFKNKKQLKCKHEFCEECLQQAKDASGPTCPVCRSVFGKIIGDQPDGNMFHRILDFSLSGFPHCNTIVISYEIPSGIQTEKHPNPGRHFHGISRSAYLPNNKEGNEVLQLLKRAFDQRLIFTVGTSRTTGMNGQVTWNDIHHKTSTTGGPQSFGYPDPEYLSRVKEELKAKGIE